MDSGKERGGVAAPGAWVAPPEAGSPPPSQLEKKVLFMTKKEPSLVGNSPKFAVSYCNKFESIIDVLEAM